VRLAVGIAAVIVVGYMVWLSKSRKSELMVPPQEAKEEAAVS